MDLVKKGRFFIASPRNKRHHCQNNFAYKRNSGTPITKTQHRSLCLRFKSCRESGEKQEARCRRNCSNDNDKSV